MTRAVIFQLKICWKMDLSDRKKKLDTPVEQWHEKV